MPIATCTSSALLNLAGPPHIFEAGEDGDGWGRARPGPVFEDDKFYLGKRLGSGSFGQVFLAKNRRGKELAVKVESLGKEVAPQSW